MFINENPFVFSHGSTICQQVAVNGCITEHDSIFVEVIPRPTNFSPFILRDFSWRTSEVPFSIDKVPTVFSHHSIFIENITIKGCIA